MDTKESQRVVRWFGLVSIIPAFYLPFYNAFLHGGRDAASIVVRSGEYAGVHILAAMASILAVFGFFALYLRIQEGSGRFGLATFMLAAFAQMLFAGELFIDGFFNPTLAHYDPVLQTHLHSSQYLSTPLHLLGAAFFFVPFTTATMIVGFLAFAIAIARERTLPPIVAPLLAVAGLFLGAALFELQWIETVGYAFLGIALVFGALGPMRFPAAGSNRTPQEAIE